MTRAGRSRSRGSWSSPCTGRTGSTRRRGQAGRRGDFLTSPEVGPLFGAVVARFLDAEWERLGRPDRRSPSSTPAPAPARSPASVLAARPACAAALRYVAVEVSDAQRRTAPGRRRVTVERCPSGPIDGVVDRQRAARQPAVPPRRARRRVARGVRDHGARRHVRRGALRPVRPGAGRPPAPAAARRQGADPGRCRGGGWSTPDRSSAAAASSSSTTPGRRRRRWRCCPWRDWLRTYRGHGRGGALSRRPRRAGHHRRRRRRPAPRAGRRARPGAVPPALRHRRAGRGGPSGVGERGGACRPGGGAGCAAAPSRPRRCSTRPASVGSPSSSGSARFRREVPTSFGPQEEVEWRIPAERRQQVAGW